MNDDLVKNEKNDGFEGFDGDPEAAKRRFAEISDLALRVLDPEKLNRISFQIAALIQPETAGFDYGVKMFDELVAERASRNLAPPSRGIRIVKR